MIENNQEEALRLLRSSIIISQILLVLHLSIVTTLFIQPAYAWTPGQTRDLWTPRLLINAPYNGKAEGKAVWSSKMKFSFPFGVESSISTTTALNRSNGECSGDFRLCRWQEYICIGMDETCAIKISESPLGYIWDRTFYIHGADKKTCADDLCEVNYGGYSSVWFDVRYKELNKIRDTDGPVTEHCHGSTYAIFEMDIKVSISKVSIGFGKCYWQRGGEWDYWYTFNGGGHRWHVDFLSSQSPSIDNDELWAFDYRY
ncbi:MAG: hypothetical protein QXU95_06045 [Candidatus Bathyarchaeia archaeon]|nr:hypothetical protein [Candidatus Bathyarchaeota archaeon]